MLKSAILASLALYVFPASALAGGGTSVGAGGPAGKAFQPFHLKCNVSFCDHPEAPEGGCYAIDGSFEVTNTEQKDGEKILIGEGCEKKIIWDKSRGLDIAPSELKKLTDGVQAEFSSSGIMDLDKDKPLPDEDMYDFIFRVLRTENGLRFGTETRAWGGRKELKASKDATISASMTLLHGKGSTEVEFNCKLVEPGTPSRSGASIPAAKPANKNNRRPRP